MHTRGERREERGESFLGHGFSYRVGNILEEFPRERKSRLKANNHVPAAANLGKFPVPWVNRERNHARR